MLVMIAKEMLEPGWNPKCVLGLRLCKCGNNDLVPKGTSSYSSQATTSKFTTSLASEVPEHVRTNRELLKRMTRHNRPSLSKQWSSQPFTSPSTDIYPSASRRMEHLRYIFFQYISISCVAILCHATSMLIL